jgi:poly-gamma-glutamate capsule biosynthesis protein CapA/YwtB (metallophosphatase superfamily)
VSSRSTNVTLLIRQLTRRRFLAVFPALLAVVLAACRGDDAQESHETPTAETEPSPTPEPEPTASPEPSPAPSPTPEPTPAAQAVAPSPTPEPRTVAIALDAELPQYWTPVLEALRSELEHLATALDIDVRWDVSESDANVALTHRPYADDDALTLIDEPLLPVVSPRLPALAVTGEQIQAVLAGQVGDWSEVGANWSVPVVRVVVSGLTDEVHDGEETVGSAGDLITFLEQNAGAIGLLPRPHIDYRAQTLVIDDRDVLRDSEAARDLPDHLTLSAVYLDDVDEDVSGVLEDAGRQINEEQRRPNPFVVTFAGDIIMGRTVHRRMLELNDFAAPLRLVADELRKGDLTVGNLECVLSDTITPPADPRTFSFMTFTAAVEGLQLAGFHALSQANNHSMDFGVAGMRDSLATLDAAGIKHYGIGENLAEAREPCILEHDGVTVALLGYDGITGSFRGATAGSAGTMPMVWDYAIEDIRNVRDHVDLVIPYFHWGVEYTLTPTPGDRQLAHAAIDAGADVVMGSHPHWVQGLEYYNGRPILYSLSNFVFDQEWSLETKQGLIVHLVFERTRLIGMRLVPVLIEDFHRPRVVEDEMREIILDRIWQSTDLIVGGG